MTNHLVIFAKSPHLGTVKSRLGRDIGNLAAWQFYRRNLRALIRRLSADHRWRTYLAVTGASARWSEISPPPVRLIEQGDGDLGQRMARVTNTMATGPVAIVGSDIPEISSAHVASAFEVLGRHDVVFGPAPDGGYWLVGQSRRRPLPQLFRNVRWSSPFALEDTLANLDRRHSHAFLEQLIDVDDEASYRAWRGC